MEVGTRSHGFPQWILTPPCQVLELSATTSVRIESRAIGDSHVEPGGGGPRTGSKRLWTLCWICMMKISKNTQYIHLYMICIYLYGIFIQDTYYLYKNTNINMFIRSYDFFDEASDACSGRSRGSSWVTWTHSKSTPVAFLWGLLNDSVSQGTQVAFLLRKCPFLQPTLYDFSIFFAFLRSWD